MWRRGVVWSRHGYCISTFAFFLVSLTQPISYPVLSCLRFVVAVWEQIHEHLVDVNGRDAGSEAFAMLSDEELCEAVEQEMVAVAAREKANARLQRLHATAKDRLLAVPRVV